MTDCEFCKDEEACSCEQEEDFDGFPEPDDYSREIESQEWGGEDK